MNTKYSQTDRQTDGQTTYESITALTACIAHAAQTYNKGVASTVWSIYIPSDFHKPLFHFCANMSFSWRKEGIHVQ